MADRCNYPSEIDMDGRMFGGEHLGSPGRILHLGEERNVHGNHSAAEPQRV
uniref:Uncharacterized protein n=1 Tax=Candidatus Kentrum sp. FM TaxID=2126340 RepID=A0A450SJM6_9GAMM|nr:MAG: hypothetical protein BECKFM1743A_GA0114220_101177 [Candidatus Kentron sp. FM]VFJ70025.1 MAG: hypothetical protein BECKFM1743C_GA0114222_105403 [Candidatus Kentron sp. FM]VFK09633.1 MAG: hypothetical protein BECKFM1743B_GA0114221_101107 [Candidatus Kentron sp. FM]